METQINTHAKLTIDQVVSKIEQHSQEGTLTLSLVSSLLKNLIYDQDLKEKIFSAPLQESPPTHRHVFWESDDKASLEGFGWAPQAATHIHSHNHEGLAKHLEGNLEAINFRLHSESDLICHERLPFSVGSIIPIPKGHACIHTVTNTCDTNPAVDIHFYSPKISEITPMRFDPIDDNFSIRKVKPGEVIPTTSKPDPAQI